MTMRTAQARYRRVALAFHRDELVKSYLEQHADGATLVKDNRQLSHGGVFNLINGNAPAHDILLAREAVL
ncbi:MAG TPA: hypothetical protein VKB88_33335, partial [Bryobacteraceae bacterium]|nr:hypothetical protein [Bryobacteraceae bacterium]